MVTGELKSQVDKIWESFWTGGIANPLTVIEQFTFLLFLRRLDERQTLAEKKANMIGTELKSRCMTMLISAFAGTHSRITILKLCLFCLRNHKQM